MVLSDVKKEGTGRRPTILSEWYRRNLGKDVAISDIDWVITSVSNKDKKTRYLILEEKNISNDDKLLIGLGQARSLKEMKEDMVRNNIPLFVIFIKDENVGNGVWIYEFDTKHVEKSERIEVNGSWYIDVKVYSKFVGEKELTEMLLKRVGSSFK